MAELAVASALGVVQIVISLLKPNKPNSHIHVKEDDINTMRSWLTLSNAFIENNDGHQSSSIKRDRIDKVRKIAYDIEDVLDHFMLHSPPYIFHSHTFTRKLHKFAHHIDHGFPLRGVQAKIATILNDIKLLREQVETFGDRDSASSSGSPIRVSPLLRDEQMVGYETHKADLMRRLVDGDMRLVVIAVDGISGSGKTTLVKNVFWKSHIRTQFDCYAWICVSENLDIETIFKNLLLQLCLSRREDPPANDGLPVQMRLKKYLTGKRYAVVLDDIWKEEHWRIWNNLEEALPDSKCGSRIIITTNNNTRVASSSHVDRCSLTSLAHLDGWKLFCRKAFPDRDGECPSEIKDTAKKIVATCEGLPLFIVTAAAALENKASHEWEKFHRNFGREMERGSNLSAISDALQPSYMNLSRSLKCCFLYMSIFPEDYSVKRGRLIRLWVAEGFAMATENHTADEVAEVYLNELIQRKLVDVSKWDFDGRPRNCRLLNIVHKFTIRKCKEETLASIFPSENPSTIQNPRQMIRRLSFHDHCKDWPKSEHLNSVRSLLLLRLSEKSPPSNLEKNLERLKLIKVIDVQGAPLTKFPKKITSFTLVRYLSFRDTKIKLIPKSIEKLSYLETLDLKQTDVTELPQEISHLQNLCHLLVYKYNESNNVDFESVEGVRLHEGISKLTNLQSLSLVKVGDNGSILRELKSLIQLRKLRLTRLKQEHGKDLCTALDEMTSLRILDLCSATKEDYIEVESIQKPPKSLQRLYLKGRIEKIPDWIPELNDLVKIGLKWSKLSYSPLEHLKGLPNLTELQLVDCYTGDNLTFEGSGFKKLKSLEVEALENVNMMVIEEGAMCEVEKVSLRRCRAMTMLLGMKNLTKMEEFLHDMAELSLYDMAEELVAQLRRNGDDVDSV